MTEKFTPGEWKVFHHKDEYMKSFDWREIVTKETPPKALVHIMYYEGMPQEEYEANAALIAAAPEMYKFISWLGSVEGQCAILTKDPEIVRRAHNLLKKARGEE